MEPTFFAQKIVLQDKETKKILLLKRSNYKKNEGELWDLPGGSVEFQENCKLAIQRECKEELNVKLNSFRIIDLVSDKGIPNEQFIFGLYLSNNFEGEITLSEEHSEFKWIDPLEINDYKLHNSIQLVKETISKL